MNLQAFWNSYKNEILLIVATSLATLVFSKLIPWIWQNLLLNSFLWVAKKVSRQWEKKGFEIEYLNWLIEDNMHLQVRGLRMRTVVSPYLESIFIPLQASASLHVGDKETGKGNITQTLVSANEMITNNKRVVILGDPGSGKTTLLRYLVLSYARLLRNNRHRGDKPDIIKRRLGLSTDLKTSMYRGDGENPLPIYISFRSVTLKQLREPNLKMDDLIFGRHLSYPNDYLVENLQDGKCILFLDGLDEVPSIERGEIVNWVEDLVCTYPDNKYIVTSRIVGYTNPLTNGFVTYKLEDFSNNDIESFIKQWYLAVETSTGRMPADQANILEQAGDLIDAIFENKQVRLLAVNPLLLSIIALVHRARVKLPEKRVDLYDECTIVLLGHWDRAKGLFGELQPSQKRTILEAVAYDMQQKKLQEITTEELTSILETELPKYGGNYQDALHFLEEIKERSGLLVERGASIFSFSHLTFQEYLAARYLTRSNNNIEILLEKIRDDQWQEVILLFCGMQDPSLLVRHILDFQDDMFFTWIALAGQCVADALFVTESLRKEIVDKLTKISIESRYSSLRVSMMKICSKIDLTTLLNAIEDGFRNLPEFNTNVVSDSISLLIDNFPDELCMEFLMNTELRFSTLRALSKKREISDRLMGVVVENLPDFNEKERMAFVRVVEKKPEAIGLDVIKQVLLYDDSERVRSLAIKIVGEHDDPMVFERLGLFMLDESGMVIDQVMRSLIGIINSKNDQTLLRLSRVSLFELFKNLRNKEKRPQSSMALFSGMIFGFGILLIRSSKFLRLNLREDRKDLVATILWGVYRGLLGTYVALWKSLLLKAVHYNDIEFWVAYHKALFAFSLNDPNSGAPFNGILPALSKKHLDFLGENLTMLNIDSVLTEELIYALITKTEKMEDLWGLGSAMDNLKHNNRDLALVLASKMVNSPLLPVRGEGIFAMYELRQYIDDEQIEILATAAKDDAYEIRQISAWAIAEIKELQTKGLIFALLKDKETKVLREILDTTGQIGSPEYIEGIRPFLLHEDATVRDAAYNSLWKIAKKNEIVISSLSGN